jgi:ArsR family transcriptional regulator
MPARRPRILDQAAVLTEPVRCRILLLLERQELAVAELCAVLRLPQSTVSRHLKALGDGGWLSSRREGTSHYHAFAPARLDDGPRRLWSLLRGELADAVREGEDTRRLEAVLAERRARSQAFYSSAAAEWDRLRDELFGDRFDLLALPGLLDPDWVLADLACGTGRVAAAVAPGVGRVLAIDSSEAMLAAARARLAHLGNVKVLDGALEGLPLDDASVDAATLFLALHHVAEPARALAEAARVLRPGGRFLLVDTMPHERDDLRQRMGHVWLGFSADQVARQLDAAGFDRCRYRPLAAGAAARGPTLFLATAERARRDARARPEDTPVTATDLAGATATAPETATARNERRPHVR